MSHPSASASAAPAESERGDLNWDLPPTNQGGIPPSEPVSEEGQRYIERPPITPNDFNYQESSGSGSLLSENSDGPSQPSYASPLTAENLKELDARLEQLGQSGNTSGGLDREAIIDAVALSPGVVLSSPGHEIPDATGSSPGKPASPIVEKPHWSDVQMMCQHLGCSDERGMALPDNFRNWGSEVCLKMWKRHHPFCNTILITSGTRQSIERDSWSRSYIKHRNSKLKYECAGPGRYCRPCLHHQMDLDHHQEWVLNNELCSRTMANISLGNYTYWDYKKYELYNIPPIQFLERNFSSYHTDKLCWFDFPFDVRERIYELLLVNRNHYTQAVQNIQIGDDQGPHELVFRPRNLRVELGNTPWNHHCRDGRYDDVPHNPCRTELHYPCTGIWPAILRTSRRVSEEACFIMYQKNVFEVSLSLESSGDPWYTLWGKHSERRDEVLKKKVIGRAIDRLYRYPEPGPLLPPMMELDDIIRAEGGDPYNMSDDGTRIERQHHSEYDNGQPDDGSGTAAGHEPDTQGDEVSVTDSDMLSQASTTEPHYPCDEDPALMPSWLSRLRLVAFLRKIGGRNASQIATVYITAFDTHEVYTMLPIFTALLRQHMSRLTTIHFELCHEEPGVETDASSSLMSYQQGTEEVSVDDSADGSGKTSNSAVYDGYPEDFDMLYPHLQWLIERVGSLKNFTYHGHWNFGKNPRFKKAQRLMARLDVPLADRRSYVQSLEALEVASLFVRKAMRYHERGKKLGAMWMWMNAEEWLPWEEGEEAEKVRGIRGWLKMEHFEEFEKRREMREKKDRAKERREERRREERRREEDRVSVLVESVRGSSAGSAGGSQGVPEPSRTHEMEETQETQEIHEAQGVQGIQGVQGPQGTQEVHEVQGAQEAQEMDELPKTQALEEVQELPSTPTMESGP